MFRSFQFAFDECLVDESFAVTFVNSLLCHASTCFRIGSPFLCIRPTPTEMQSMSENDFEFFASTGVTSGGQSFNVAVTR